jgi:hypothetical protein
MRFLQRVHGRSVVRSRDGRGAACREGKHFFCPVVHASPVYYACCAWNENCISEDEVGTKPLILSVKLTCFKRAVSNHRCGALRPEGALSHAAQATQAAREMSVRRCTKKNPTSLSASLQHLHCLAGVSICAGSNVQLESRPGHGQYAQEQGPGWRA